MKARTAIITRRCDYKNPTLAASLNDLSEMLLWFQRPCFLASANIDN
jgi:hypothetical protein